MGRLTMTVLCGVVLLGWQFTTVTLNYGGNWTALFCAGDRPPVPPQLAAENIYIFPGTDGFDGQFYHYIAHEPVPGALSPYVEAGRLRYRRILLPAMAFGLSLGQQGAIDIVYLGAGLGFLLLGIWWMGKIGSDLGLHPAWALLFAAVPASLVFIDRLTVDHVLAALAVGFAYYSTRRPSWQLFLILMLAPLARELGLLLIAAYCGCLFWRRQWRLAVIFATAAIPSLAWSAWLAATIGVDSYPTTIVPLKNLLNYLFHPIDYPPEIPLAGFVQVGDAIALLGMLLAVGLAVALAWRQRFEPVAVAAVLFAAVTVFVQRGDVWQTVYNYGRIFSPLLVLVAVGWWPRRPWLGALPLLMILPRVLMQFGRQVVGIAGSLGF